MKKIFVISDTHDMIDSSINAISKTDDLYAIIHAGDYVRDAVNIKRTFPEIPIYYVRGNNDFDRNVPSSLTVTIDGVRIFIVHGHEHGVKLNPSLTRLIEAGENINADVIIFGHTHQALTEYHGKMTILNPGSAGFFRTYAMLEIENGSYKTEIKEFER